MNVNTILLKSAARALPIKLAPCGVEWAAGEIAAMFSERPPRVAAIGDERVDLLYGRALTDTLTSAGFDAINLSFPPGESSKNLRIIERLADRVIEQKFARDDVIIGLGGGVSTDAAGFVAAIVHRGMRWIAVPTTLMGMADAAIGGKTGVDHPLGKNLIGAFHQPLAVLAPVRTLDSLPAREWTSGSAEVVKSALIQGGEFWRRIAERGVNLREQSAAEQLWAIEAAARAKAEIVSQDEHEAGLRRVLNLGHTFAHALETATNYAVYRHGEAVMLGLRAAIRVSERHGLLPAALAVELDEVLKREPMPAATLQPVQLIEALSRDKKVAAGRIHWVLVCQPGKVVVVDDVPTRIVQEATEWLCDVAAQGTACEAERASRRVLVINGPNLNLLGTREPGVYGTESLDELERFCEQTGEQLDLQVLCRQSNHEGELVTLIQLARHWADAILINPGGYTHTSVAIRDALSAVKLLTVEVHLSDITQREEFRRTSMIRDVCISTISGRGRAGYAHGLAELAKRLHAAS
jgi:3-dehydroquinate synthase